jgi:hypothetical protein
LGDFSAMGHAPLCEAREASVVRRLPSTFVIQDYAAVLVPKLPKMGDTPGRILNYESGAGGAARR